jgi:hypothetical protein
MTNRTNRWLLSGLALAALAATACDPFPAANKEPPKVVRVMAYDRYLDPAIIVETPDADGGYTITGINIGRPDAATATEPARWFGTSLLIQFNKMMDPLSIQSQATQTGPSASNIDACVPAAGITITGPVEAGVTRWLACYNPSQPDATAGGQMIIWKALLANGTDTRASRLPAGATITVTGTVRDQDGHPLPIKLTAITDP